LMVRFHRGSPSFARLRRASDGRPDHTPHGLASADIASHRHRRMSPEAICEASAKGDGRSCAQPRCMPAFQRLRRATFQVIWVSITPCRFHRGSLLSFSKFEIVPPAIRGKTAIDTPSPDSALNRGSNAIRQFFAKLRRSRPYDVIVRAGVEMGVAHCILSTRPNHRPAQP
jgi:hypothetical protein